MKKRITGVNQNNNLNSSMKPNCSLKTDNMQNPILSQINQEKPKDRDIILKTKYSASLKSSAENFLIDLFEKMSTLNDFDNVDIEIPISAAMAIISNISWHQPTEAQVEYHFTRECMDNGLYTIQIMNDDILSELEKMEEDEEMEENKDNGEEDKGGEDKGGEDKGGEE
jgi:hypothetical protein